MIFGFPGNTGTGTATGAMTYQNVPGLEFVPVQDAGLFPGMFLLPNIYAPDKQQGKPNPEICMRAARAVGMSLATLWWISLADPRAMSGFG